MTQAKRFLRLSYLSTIIIALLSIPNFAQSTNPWVGTWYSSYGPIKLSENNGIISGNYHRPNGETGFISSGIASGNVLTGRWREPTTYAPPYDEGDFIFTLSEDKLSFSGKWRYDQGSLWFGWLGSKGFGITGKVEMYDGSPFNGCEVELIQNNQTVKKMYTNSSGTFMFLNIQPGTYQVEPFSLDYIFNPKSRTVTLETKSISGIDFKVANTFYITILFSDKSIAYEQEIDLSVEIKDSAGNFINEQHSVQFSEINTHLGTFTPSNALVTTSGGKAAIKYKAPSKAQAGTFGYLLIRAEDKTINFNTILKIPFDLEVWAEPKDPAIGGNSKIAIIPADENFPALISAKCVDASGKAQVNVPIKFSLDINSSGILYSSEQNSKSITVNTKDDGIAQVYYKYIGAYTGTKIIEEVTVENMNDNRVGVVKIEVGLGLEIYKKERYQAQGGVIASGIGQNLVLYIRSIFHPEMDLESYSFWADTKVWKGKEIGVNISVEWANKPNPEIWDKFFTLPADEVYKGKCGMDRLGEKNILYAWGTPCYDIGENHMLPQIIPKSEGSHIYSISAKFIDSNGNSGNEEVMIRYPMLGLEVDREISDFENFVCAMSPSSSLQAYFYEGSKILLMFKVLEDISLLGDCVSIVEMTCKFMQGDKIGALKIIANALGSKYVDAKNDEFLKYPILKEMKEKDYIMILTGWAAKWGVAVSQALDSYYKAVAEEESSNKLYKTNSYIDNVNKQEYQDIINQLFISFLAGAKINDFRIVNVFNASQSKVTDNTGKEASFIDKDYSNLGPMMFYSKANVFSYILDVNSTFNLEFKTDKNFAVSICDPLKSTYTLYNMPSSQLLKGKLVINNSSNPLQLDYGDNGSIDENKNPEVITPGQSGGGINKLEFDWTFHAGGEGIDAAWRVRELDNSNIVMGGRFEKTMQFDNSFINYAGTYDFYIASLSKTKKLNWVYSGGGTGDDGLSDLIIDKDGNIVFTGVISQAATYDNIQLISNGERDACIVKVDKNGKHIWSLSFGGTGNDDGARLGIDGNNNYYLVGSFSSPQIKIGATTLTNTNTGSEDIFIVKLSPSGSVLWVKSMGGIDLQRIWGVHVLNDGTFLVTGWFTNELIVENTTYLSKNASIDLFVSKYSNEGKVIWLKVYGGAGSDYPYGIKTDAEENIFLTGTFSSSYSFGDISLSNKGGEDIFLAKLNYLGNPIWVKTAGGAGNDRAYSLALDKQSNVSIAGYICGDAQFENVTLNCTLNQSVSFLVIYNKDGNLLATSIPKNPDNKTYTYNLAYHHDIDNSGNYYLLGIFMAPVTFNNQLICRGTSDVYLVKYKPFYTTNIFENNLTEIPSDFHLYQNYPNPFNPVTTIRYHIAVGSHVTLKVFDILGREVTTLVNEFLNPGIHNSQFSIRNSELPSGVYFYQLRAGSFTETRKLVLMK
ncbi:MAG: T9SS type A sorting domain-containing protein [Ignavibacteriales bacterium]|nr:T9SS type A sorting domain-containing protein [Ignavibacteriales bacterium]